MRTKSKAFVLYAMPENLYSRSQTVVGPLYDEGGARWDWGFLSIAVQEEKRTVTITPASDELVRLILRTHGWEHLLDT